MLTISAVTVQLDDGTSLQVPASEFPQPNAGVITDGSKYIVYQPGEEALFADAWAALVAQEENHG